MDILDMIIEDERLFTMYTQSKDEMSVFLKDEKDLRRIYAAEIKNKMHAEKQRQKTVCNNIAQRIKAYGKHSKNSLMVGILAR